MTQLGESTETELFTVSLWRRQFIASGNKTIFSGHDILGISEDALQPSIPLTVRLFFLLILKVFVNLFLRTFLFLELFNFEPV